MASESHCKCDGCFPDISIRSGRETSRPPRHPPPPQQHARTHARVTHHTYVVVMESALDLMRRLPPQNVQSNLSGLVDLAPHMTEEFLSRIDQPLLVAHDDVAHKNFLLCDYNRDMDSYRSPWQVKGAMRDKRRRPTSSSTVFRRSVVSVFHPRRTVHNVSLSLSLFHRPDNHSVRRAANGEIEKNKSRYRRNFESERGRCDDDRKR